MADDSAGCLPATVLRVVDDPERLATLRGLQVLDTAADADFDRLTGLAATLLNAPVALVTLVDTERQWFRGRTGVDMTETPVGISFCAYAIATGDDVTVVEDAEADPRFAGNPLVTGEHHLRFYIGVPIVVGGARLGTLCVLDRVARPRPPPELIIQLQALASLACSLLTLKENTRTSVLTRAALVREEKRRALAVDAASLASWVWNIGTDTIECDSLLPALMNLPRAISLRGRDVFLSIDRRDVVQAEAKFRTTLLESDDYLGEYRIRNVEPERWLASRGRVIERDDAGKPTLVFGVTYDISERKSTEQRQRTLLRELNHRVKNTLATVQALATQTVRHSREPGEFLKAFSSRLQALGLAHGMLSDREWRGIGIRELVQREVSPFDDKALPRIVITGEDVLLSPDQALGLGLTMHELASNAVKYGALSVPEGEVELSWTVSGRHDKRRLLVKWREMGGPRVAPPDRQGFGSILIRRSLAKVLSSAVRHEFAPEGVSAEIELPLEQQLD